MKYVDAHIHLEKYSDEEIQSFFENPDLLHVLAVSMDFASSVRTLKLKNQYPERIFAACGFHPEQEVHDLDALLHLIRSHIDQIDAIGEIGLPYYVKKNSPQVNQLVLETMLELAATWQKPVILHAVAEDVATVFDYLQAYKIRKAHFHWIKTDTKTLSKLANAGYYVSFTPDIWYNDETAQIAIQYPLSYILVETDGPWRFKGPFSNQPTTPRLVEQVILRMAKLKQVEPKRLAKILLKNSYRFLGID